MHSPSFYSETVFMWWWLRTGAAKEDSHSSESPGDSESFLSTHSKEWSQCR